MPEPSQAERHPPAREPARADRGERPAPRRRPAADGGGPVRLSRLRHGAPDGAPARAEPGRARRPGRDPDPPDRDGGVRRGEGRDLAHHAGAPAGRRLGEGRLRDRARAPRRGDLRRSSGPCPSTTAAIRRSIDFEPPVSNTTPDGVRGDGRRGRRNTSAPATSSRSCCRSASRRAFPLPAFALYRSLAAGQPGAVPLLSRLRGFPDRLLVAGDPGARARRQGHDPPDRRHPPARRDRRPRTAPTRKACSPTRRSAPST